MRRISTPLILLVLLAGPTGAAAWTRDPIVLELPPFRGGDAMRYEWRESVDGEERHASTTLVQVEGPTTAVDAFGASLPAESFLVEARRDEEPRSLVRCHRLAGDWKAVRQDLLFGGWSRTAASSAGQSIVAVQLSGAYGEVNSTATTTFWPFCGVLHLQSASRIVEGESLPLGGLLHLSDLPPKPDDVLSEPASRATWNGRAALVHRFDIRAFFGPEAGSRTGPLPRGHVEFVFAEGLPGLAEMRSDVVFVEEGTERAFRSTSALVGFAGGDGDPLAPYRGGEPRRLDPPITAWPYEPLWLPLDAFGLPYPFEDALSTLLEDEDTGVRDFLDRHPDAVITVAAYDRERGVSLPVPSLEPLGEWSFAFSSKESVYWAETVRSRAPGPLPLASQVLTQNLGFEADLDPLGKARPPETSADGATLLRTAERHGLPAERVKSLRYDLDAGLGHHPPQAYLTLSDVSASEEGRHEGVHVTLDVELGAAVSVGVVRSERFETGLARPLAPAPGSVEVEPVSTLASLAGPGVGAGLGATGATATGVALLVLFLKFVAFPLYTRLVRGRLLESPARADLMRRVRASPGVRLAELVRGASVSESAVRRHLSMLAKHGFLVELREGGTVSYYARGEVPPEAARRSALLRRRSTRSVYDVLSREPGLSLREVGKRLGLSAPSVLRHRRMLEKAGLLAARGAKPVPAQQPP